MWQLPGALQCSHALDQQAFSLAGLQVQLTGKPDAIVYEEAMKMLDLPADEVLGIGDSIEHDIQGQSIVLTPCLPGQQS